MFWLLLVAVCPLVTKGFAVKQADCLEISTTLCEKMSDHLLEALNQFKKCMEHRELRFSSFNDGDCPPPCMVKYISTKCVVRVTSTNTDPITLLTWPSFEDVINRTTGNGGNCPMPFVFNKIDDIIGEIKNWLRRILEECFGEAQNICPQTVIIQRLFVEAYLRFLTSHVNFECCLDKPCAVTTGAPTTTAATTVATTTTPSTTVAPTTTPTTTVAPTTTPAAELAALNEGVKNKVRNGRGPSGCVAPTTTPATTVSPTTPRTTVAPTTTSTTTVALTTTPAATVAPTTKAATSVAPISTAAATTCGTHPYPVDIREQRSGWIASPEYPNNYPNNYDCAWRITGDINTFVGIQFKDFCLEQSYDHVRIYNGATSSAGLIASLDDCGNPGSFNSTGRQMLIRFTSDASAAYRGFNLTWQTYEQA